MARVGAHGVGYEINTTLVAKSEHNLEKEGLANSATIYQRNFWEAVMRYRKIAVYQSPGVMERLEQIFLESCPDGTRIVSHHWQFPHLEPVKQVEDVYLYIKGVSKIREK